MTNKEKFSTLVSKEKTNTLERNSERIKNRAMLRESQQIAIKVLKKLDELGWSQKALAVKLDVSPQQVTKIVSGKENLTIETQIKIQNVLDIPILATYYEKREREMHEWILTLKKKMQQIKAVSMLESNNYQETKVIRINRPAIRNEKFDLVS